MAGKKSGGGTVADHSNPAPAVRSNQNERRKVNDRKKSVITRSQGDIRVSAPLFIQATKDSALTKLMKEEVAALGKVIGWRYKVVEKSGKMIRDMLVRTSVFRGDNCGRPGCGACKCAEKPLNCRRRGIMYETACQECKSGEKFLAVYVGESARSGSERMTEHLDNARDR